MAQDIQKKSGTISNYQNDRGGAVLINHPVIAIVKDNIDPTHSGRIRVYIANYGGINPEDEKSWVTVSYMSPYFGIAAPNNDPYDGPDKSGSGSYIKNPHSYGFWASAPDIGTEVICIFINGNPSQGYYIGAAPTVGAHHMVPGIGASDSVVPNESEATSYGGAKRLPVTEVNISSPDALSSGRVYSLPKPVHSYQASILNTQGLIRDSLRGVISSSSQRETPSRVFGISTPGGTIYEGGFNNKTIKSGAKSADNSKLKLVGRTGGHSILLDDGTVDGKDQLMRIRTSAGHMIMMNDSGQNIFIIHSNGQSWVELGKEGTVDIFSTNSFNVRTQGDINMHADRDVNIHAKRNLNVFGDNINIEAEKNLKERAGQNFNNYTLGKFTVKVDGTMSLQSGGDSSFASKGINYINGSKVHLNTGQGPQAENVALLTKVAHVDSAFSQSVGWVSVSPEGPTLSITTRLTAHQPWEGANLGVDIKNSPPSTDSAPPSKQVQAVNNAVPEKPSTPVSTPAVSTVPPVPAVTGVGDKVLVPQNTAVAAVAQQAATGSGLSDAAKIAAGVMPGAAAATLTQLTAPGQIIKLGSEQFVSDLRAKLPTQRIGEAVSQAMMTGKDGVKNLEALVNNPAAQVKSVAASMQTAANDLIKNGIISGKESPTDVTGIISAAAAFGTKAVKGVLDNVTGVAGQIGEAVQGALGQITGAADTAINKIKGIGESISGGKFAAGIADRVTGALGGVADGLGKLIKDLDKGIGALTTNLRNSAKAAFDIIEKSFQQLKAGMPNSLTGQDIKQTVSEIEKQFNKLVSAEQELASAESALIAAKAELRSSSSPDNLAAVQQAEGILNSAKQKLAKAGSAIVTGAEGVVNNLTSGLTGVAGAATAAVAAAGTVGDIVKKLPGTGLNAIPGGLGAYAGQVTAEATNVLKSVKDIAGRVESGISGGNLFNPDKLAGNLVGNLNTAIGGLKSKLSGLEANVTGGLAQLDALAKNGPAQIKALLGNVGNSGIVKPPIMAKMTFDASAIKAKAGELLGDNRIPPPVFEDISVDLEPDPYLQAQNSAIDDIRRLRSEIKSQKTKISMLFTEYQQADSATVKFVQDQLDAENKKLVDLETQLNEAHLTYERVIGQA